MLNRDDLEFKEVVRILSKTLAVSYKEDYPECEFNKEELALIFYERIMLPVEKKSVRKDTCQN